MANGSRPFHNAGLWKLYVRMRILVHVIAITILLVSYRYVDNMKHSDRNLDIGQANVLRKESTDVSKTSVAACHGSIL